MPIIDKEELKLLRKTGRSNQHGASQILQVAEQAKPKLRDRIARTFVNRLLPSDARTNIRNNVAGIFGDEFTPQELEAIENTVLDNVTLDQVGGFAAHPMGKNDYPNAPLTADQLKRFDGLVAGMPNDPLSARAKSAYARARAPGGRLVKR